MIQKIGEPITVGLLFDHRRRLVHPNIILWKGRRYLVDRLGLHHRLRQGQTLYHIFSLSAQGVFFRLSLNTDNLHWRLEEISDGQVA